MHKFFSLISATAVASIVLSSCALSPEALKQARAKKLETFAGDVTKHLLDKNPATLNNSILAFRSDEVSPDERDKLEQLKIIPDSPISVDKLQQENEAAGRSNEVVISSVVPISPTDADSVKFKVDGKEISKLKGNVTDTRAFSYELTVLLNAEMSGYPQLTDLKGFTAPAATADSSNQSSKNSKRGRRRRG
jgi:hypothetical protein